MNEEYRVGSYLFGTAADAELAKEELEQIQYLNKNMNYSNPEKVMQLYNKALDSKTFRTPIGWEYMNRIRMVLVKSGYEDSQLRPIPLYTVFAGTEEGTPLKQRIKPSAKKADPYMRKYFISVMISIVLLIAVIAMFIIAVQSETPNMLNYRNAIINEYASWEQDIKDREDAVRAREKELGMVSPLPHDEQEENK